MSYESEYYTNVYLVLDGVSKGNIVDPLLTAAVTDPAKTISEAPMVVGQTGFDQFDLPGYKPSGDNALIVKNILMMDPKSLAAGLFGTNGMAVIENLVPIDDGDDKMPNKPMGITPEPKVPYYSPTGDPILINSEDAIEIAKQALQEQETVKKKKTELPEYPAGVIPEAKGAGEPMPGAGTGQQPQGTGY